MALLAGLAILACISLLALVSTASMALQHNMTGNFTDQQLADQGALEAVYRGKHFLYSLDASTRAFDCLEDCFDSPVSGIVRTRNSAPAFPELESLAWWQTWGIDARLDPLTGTAVESPWTLGSEPPRYLLEELYFDQNPEIAPVDGAPSIEGIGYYRVLGRGSGLGPAAVAVEEVIFARPWAIEEETGDPLATVESFCAVFTPWYDCGVLTRRQRR
jgi:Tfp pilus assembly protein PilX